MADDELELLYEDDDQGDQDQDDDKQQENGESLAYIFPSRIHVCISD